MAGSYLKHDRAIDQFSGLRANYYRFFRFTPKMGVVSIVGMLGIPALAVYTFSQQDLKWDWRGKKRGESLASA